MPPRPQGPPKPAADGGVWADAPERLVGQTLAGRYRLERPIGSGGMGTVFLAEHVVIHKPVAIKVLSPEHSRKREEVERFLGEARAASKIRHEHVVDITDFGSADGRVFLVMEYLDGEDLATTCEREGAMPWRRAGAMVLQIAAALEAAHAQGIVHRDMKPENCFRIRRGDDPDFIKVLDFGIARMIDEKRSNEQRSNSGSGLIGTPEYVAPELVRGLKGDARVDIYAVGVIFYRLLTGRVPFLGDTFMATLTAHLTAMPPSPSELVPEAGIPPGVEDVVMRALAKEPDQRFSTIAELSAALRAALLVAGGPAPVDAERRGIHPRVVLAVVVALIVLFAAVLWYVVQAMQDRDAVAVAQVEPVAPTPAPPPTVAREAKTGAQTEAPSPPAPEVGTTPADGPTEAPPDAPPPTPAPAGERGQPATAAKRPRGPEKLAADDFAAGMAKLAPRVKLECSRFSLRKMAVTVDVVVGPDGRVKSAAPTGSQAGSTLGDCVARVVKTAELGAARTKSSHRHTFTM